MTKHEKRRFSLRWAVVAVSVLVILGITQLLFNNLAGTDDALVVRDVGTAATNTVASDDDAYADVDDAEDDDDIRVAYASDGVFVIDGWAYCRSSDSIYRATLDGMVCEELYRVGRDDPRLTDVGDGGYVDRDISCLTAMDGRLYFVEFAAVIEERTHLGWEHVMSMLPDGSDVTQVTPGDDFRGRGDDGPYDYEGGSRYTSLSIQDGYVYGIGEADTRYPSGLTRRNVSRLPLADPAAGWQYVCDISASASAAVADGWVYDLQPLQDAASGRTDWVTDFGSHEEGDELALRRRSIVDGTVETIYVTTRRCNNLSVYDGRLYFVEDWQLMRIDLATGTTELSFYDVGDSYGWSIGPDGLVAATKTADPYGTDTYTIRRLTLDEMDALTPADGTEYWDDWETAGTEVIRVRSEKVFDLCAAGGRAFWNDDNGYGTHSVALDGTSYVADAFTRWAVTRS